MIDRGLGRVEILGLLVAERAGTEADHRPARGDQRHHEPVAEPVVDPRPALTLHRQSRQHQRLLVQPGAQPVRQVSPAGRRQPEAERAQGLLGDAARGEVGTRITAALRIAQPLLECGRRQFQRLEQRRAHRPLPRPALGDGDPGTPAEQLDRLKELHLLVLLHESEHVTAGLAAEAVIELPVRADRERRRLLLVERTEPGPVAADAPQLDHLAHHLDDVARAPHALDPVVGHARAATGNGASGGAHRIAATVTPRPPSPIWPRRWAVTCGCPRR